MNKYIDTLNNEPMNIQINGKIEVNVSIDRKIDYQNYEQTD